MYTYQYCEEKFDVGHSWVLKVVSTDVLYLFLIKILAQTDLSAFICILFLGNGGNAGNVNIHYARMNGQVNLKSCRGNGAPPANNGAGGLGKREFVCLPP